MLLAIDIGNTNITFGAFEGKKLLKKFDIPTKAYTAKKVKGLLGKTDIEDAVICSVVPKVARLLGNDLKRLLGRRPYYIGKELIVPIKNLYRRPRQVGQDRLVNAYAAAELYEAPLVVVDFGTAVTFDAVSKNKEYLGGLILPGLKISLEALAERTALLPKIKLSAPKEFIGRGTKSSMISGIIYGFAALTDNLIERLREENGKAARVIATGGDSRLLKNYCRGIDNIEDDLALKGLNLIYRYAVMP